MPHFVALAGCALVLGTAQAARPLAVESPARATAVPQYLPTGSFVLIGKLGHLDGVQLQLRAQDRLILVGAQAKDVATENGLF